MLKQGEAIVDLLGGEIDRIEMKLRVSLDWDVNSRCSHCSCFRKTIRKYATVIWRSYKQCVFSHLNNYYFCIVCT